MPMLACVHHVSWVVPSEGGKHTCSYCREIVTKKDVYPKWEDLGTEYQRKWDAHETGQTAPGATAPANTAPASPPAPSES